MIQFIFDSKLCRVELIQKLCQNFIFLNRPLAIHQKVWFWMELQWHWHYWIVNRTRSRASTNYAPLLTVQDIFPYYDTWLRNQRNYENIYEVTDDNRDSKAYEGAREATHFCRCFKSMETAKFTICTIPGYGNFSQGATSHDFPQILEDFWDIASSILPWKRKSRFGDERKLFSTFE